MRPPLLARSAPAVRAAAIALGAFLLFQVQLIAAKALLPKLGGAPAVWTTCMLFFQVLLLLGYAYAHATTRWLGPRAQAGLHMVLLILALLALPIAPDVLEPGSGAPIPRILLHLARSVALPCFVLCASSPLLQAWSARERGGKAASAGTYRLYALSNAGSMFGLLCYPFAVEPWLATRAQEKAWSVAFAGFALLSVFCAWSLWRAMPAAGAAVFAAEADEREAAALRGPRSWLAWLALPACATTLLLAVTNQMCQEVAVVPLLWVVPLGLYLFSFVLSFGGERWYARSWCYPVLILALAVLAQAHVLGARVGIAYAVPVYSLGLFVCCLFCHGELAARRPPAQRLTSFYLSIALGGALGGVFVGLLAPILFRGFDELLVGLLLCGVLAAAFAATDPSFRKAGRGAWHPIVPALFVLVAVIALSLGTRLLTRTRPGLRELRDFFGLLRIEDLPAPSGPGTMRYLTHGGTRHGQQFRDAERRRLPTTYYGRTSGIGILLDELSTGIDGDPPRRVGIVGLGAGILAAYGRAGDTYRFYEISPLVIEVAQHEFTFLADSAAEVELVPGDARLSLEGEADQRFDVLVLDAFSSDAIPVHLLTVEAFELYRRHLAPGGVLALHVTTRHLDLGPLVRDLALGAKLATWEIESAADEEQGLLAARWILLSSDPRSLAGPRVRAAGKSLAAGTGPPRAWTDDYSNLLQVLR